MDADRKLPLIFTETTDAEFLISNLNESTQHLANQHSARTHFRLKVDSIVGMVVVCGSLLISNLKNQFRGGCEYSARFSGKLLHERWAFRPSFWEFALNWDIETGRGFPG
jgi:hypothetical protein